MQIYVLPGSILLKKENLLTGIIFHFSIFELTLLSKREV